MKSQLEGIMEDAEDRPGAMPVRTAALPYIHTRWGVNHTSARQARPIGVTRTCQGMSMRPIPSRFGLRAPSPEKAAQRPCHDFRGRQVNESEAANP